MGVATGLILAGTAMSAFGQYQAGEEADITAKYNQQVKEREAQAAEQQAMVASRKQAEESSRKMAALRTGLGASGAVTTSGAPLAILGEQAKQSELENLEIGQEGIGEARMLRSEGQMIRRKGKSAKRAGRIGAGGTLLTGFGSTFSG